MNHRCPASLILLLATAPLARCGLNLFQKAPAQYHLAYSVAYQDLKRPKAVQKGRYDLAERDGRLLLKVVSNGGPNGVMVYDGKKTLTVLGSKAASWTDGYSADGVGLRLLLPFDYRSVPRYLAPRPTSHAQAALALGSGPMPFDIAVNLDEKGAGPAATARLTVGPPTAPQAVEEMSDLVRFQGVEVPRKIVLTRYRQFRKGERSFGSSPTDRLVFRLLESDSTYSPNPTLDPGRLVEGGTLVSYVGPRGEGGAVYDPSKGSLQSQLDQQIAFRKASPEPLVSGSRQGTTAWIPMALAGVFGLGAVGLILARKKAA